jgi:mono/diheme cytochrome c family protein
MQKPERPMRFLNLMFLAATLVTPTVMTPSQELRDKSPGAQRPDIASGQATFVRYCASCHGVDGTGNGPVAAVLKPPPTDLTTISKKNEGKYPVGFVAAVLKFGRNLAAHGSQDMPVWGSHFKAIDPVHDPTGQKHVDDVVAYIGSLQIK